MVVYDARHGGGKRRIRWKRVALWTFGSLLILLLAIGGVVGYWAHGLVDSISHLDKSTKAAQGDLVQIPTANQAAVGLVIGSDKRQGDGVNDSRSDTLMLVRIDPQTHYISLLSLPRDLWVDIPGYGENKINAAYEQGGVKLALKTVESVTGVDVNYLMVVDFSGFTRLVNAFGGVYVPVDQYYQHTNTPGTEQYAQIDVKPGYQLLHGTDALGFARYRHTDSDFYRNARQQTFLQAFQARASEKLHGIDLTEIGTYKDIAETIADSVQVTGRNGPPSVQTMISYATLAYESRGHVVSSRLTAGAGMIGDASVVTTTPEDMHTAVYAFTHPTVAGQAAVPTGKKPANTAKFKPAVEPAGVSLTSVNGNGVTGSAAKAGAALAPLRIPGRRQPGAGADVRLLAELGLLPSRPAEGCDRRGQDHGQRADCARCRPPSPTAPTWLSSSASLSRARRRSSRPSSRRRPGCRPTSSATHRRT